MTNDRHVKIRANLHKRIQLPLLITTLTIAAFIWGAFTVKEKIFPYKIAKNIYIKLASFEPEPEPEPEPANSSFETDKLWAEKISKGGYILHFRHAQREQWHDVIAFDKYEIYTKSNGESSSYSAAICLTTQGIEEAKLIGKVFNINGVKVDKVISSPSCRAKQTARFAFGKIDFVDISLLYRAVMMKDQYDHHAHQLRNLYLKHPPSQSGNVIFSGHGGTLEYYANIIFDANETGGLDLKETGFIVIENVNGNLYARYRFDSILTYVQASLKLPTGQK